MKMTNQNNLNKDFVKMFETLSQSINDLRKAVTFIAEDVRDLKLDKMDISSQNVRNNNFNDRLINLEENKIKVIDEELKRIDTLEQAFNREF
tara:strand:- start:488 stop:763 length:276 start_codon:yes stop_codon:yes gene_type:complete